MDLKRNNSTSCNSEMAAVRMRRLRFGWLDGVDGKIVDFEDNQEWFKLFEKVFNMVLAF